MAIDQRLISPSVAPPVVASSEGALRINIIGKSNGVGLARDLKLLADCLQGCGHLVTVHPIDYHQARRRRSLLSQSVIRLEHVWRSFSSARRSVDADVNLMLEHVWPEFLALARVNVVVPNPEWFDRNDLRFLSRLDRVWAKTQRTAEIFRNLGCATTLIGFDSDDRYEPSVPRERTFFHLAGKSTMKGTDRLVRLWAQHEHWPKLIVVQHRAELHAPEISARNIERRVGYLDDTKLLQLQNASMFHLCPSLTEGWGHYLAEALGIGAVPITVDAPPMNEMVTAERGLLVPHDGTGRQRLATTYTFSEPGLVAAVEAAIAMNKAEWARLSGNARYWFLANRAGFVDRLQGALREVQPLMRETGQSSVRATGEGIARETGQR